MKGRAGIAGNPVLIGAATILVVLVAVFLAYNANQGLPFVPTYQLKRRGAERGQPRGRQRGADRRLARRLRRRDRGRAPRRRLHDRRARPQARARRRPAPARLDADRSGRARRSASSTSRSRAAPTSEGFDDGATIPLAAATPAPVEFDEVLNMFDEETRDAIAVNTDGLRRRVRGPRRVDQQRDRRLPAAAARHRPGRAEPVVAGDQPAPLLRRAGRRGGDRRAGGRGAGRAVRQPRHHVRRAARGRAALHPGLDHRRRARRSTPRSGRSRSSGRSCATPRACSASCSRAPPRCGPRRRRSPTRSRSARACCRARRRSTAGSPRCSTSCRPSPRTRMVPRGLDATTATLESLNPTLAFLAPAQTRLQLPDAVVPQRLLAAQRRRPQRHLAALHHRRHAAGPEQRGRPVVGAGRRADRRTTTCTPTRTRTPRRPGQPRECEAGNEPFQRRPHGDRQRRAARSRRATEGNP